MIRSGNKLAGHLSFIKTIAATVAGKLITREHDTCRVTCTEYDGTITVLIDKSQGNRLNAPNDVVVHSNGSTWFTDPGYEILSKYDNHLGKFDLAANVYPFYLTTGEINNVTDELIQHDNN